MKDGSLYEDGGREALRHVRMIEFRKAEWCLAELAILLLRMGEPFHQTVLMDELDAATAFARIEEWLIL
jgi:hypothetical protein